MPAEESSVFFSGIPITVSDEEIRNIFERVGHIYGMRVLNTSNALSRNEKRGFVDYADGQTARTAVQRLDGYVFGAGASGGLGIAEKKLRVAFPGDGKRKRSSNQDSSSSNAAQSTNSLHFPAGQQSSAIATALSKGISTSDAYEAVEQLRVLAHERPQVAEQLLDMHPSLKAGVMLILRHAGKLPQRLPYDAFEQHSQSQEIQQESASQPANSTETPPPASPSSVEPRSHHLSMSPEELQTKLEKLTDAQVEKLMTMTEEQFSKLKEPAQSQLRALQAHLKDLQMN